jgi:retron-type reverse transcriptase
MPTGRDRVVQQACQSVIEPLFDANFQDTSYGFRPKRRATQAVQGIQEQRVSPRDVVDIDRARFFDTRDHGLRMRWVVRRLSDRRGLQLLRQWLKAGVVEAGQWHPTPGGSPQGGGSSPVVSNRSLHGLDRYGVQQ